MTLEFRAVVPDEFETLRQTMGLVFGFDPTEGDERFRQLLSLERTRCGFDDGKMISTSGAFDLVMTVPGGEVACGGTTAVAVAPTHRRQGVLREMMRAHLDDVKEHEEPIAGLWASDSAIYGRFGYGCASLSYEIGVDLDHTGWNRLAPEAGRVRIVGRDEAIRLGPPLHDRLRKEVPGFFERVPLWWENRSFRDTESAREGSTSLRYAVVDGDDGISGLVTYRSKADWNQGHGAGKVVVKDLFGTDPGSWASLWSYVLSQDLMTRAEADLRPTWDPLFDLLAGTRRARAIRSDGLWVRLMDVPAALTARAYSAPVDVVLEVSDPLGDVSGSYRLRADEDGAACTTTTDPPSVRLDLEDLSSGYMGWPRFGELARSGRLSGDPRYLSAMDAAFRWDPPPWCPEIF
ncbi:MAG: GNAT family N-acetyltransferase [Acidimicrobiia bacterium]